MRALRARADQQPSRDSACARHMAFGMKAETETERDEHSRCHVSNYRVLFGTKFGTVSFHRARVARAGASTGIASRRMKTNKR